MDAAACRRLQHRMESRGRAASTHTVCNLCGYHCSCTQGAVNAPYVRMNNAAGVVGSTAQAWLLQRVQGFDVDITDGGTDHRRSVRCCCSCCNGYHHLFHAQKNNNSGDNNNTGYRGGGCACGTDEGHGGAGVGRVTMNANTQCSSSSSPGKDMAGPKSPSPSPGQQHIETRGNKVEGNMQAQPFRPARSSLMLSPFIRLAESLPQQWSSGADEKRNHESEECNQIQSSKLPPEDYGSAQKGDGEARRSLCLFAPRFSFSAAGSAAQSQSHQNLPSTVNPVVPVALQQNHSEQQQQQSSSVSSSLPVIADTRACSVAGVNETATTQSVRATENTLPVSTDPSLLLSGIPLMGSISGSYSLNPNLPVPASGTTAAIHPGLAPLTATSVLPTPNTSVRPAEPAGTSQMAAPVPGLAPLTATSVLPTPNTSVRPAEPAGTSQMAAPVPGLAPLTATSVLPTPNTSVRPAEPAGTSQMAAPVPGLAPLTATSVLPTPNTSVRPAEPAGTSQVAAPVPGLAPLTATSVLPTPNTSVRPAELAIPSTDPTPADVINALREKLLLEKADAYVRGLEQQQEEEQLAQEEEERQRLKKHEQILELLVRLRKEDHEMLEALYENILQASEASPHVLQSPMSTTTTPAAALQPNLQQFPEGVKAAYAMDTKKAVPSTSQQQPTAPTMTEKLSSSALPTAPSQAGMPSAQRLQSAWPTQAELPPPLPPPPVAFTAPPSPQALPTAATAASLLAPPGVPWGSGDGTMKAWVDKHFEASLDPQHRALLYHVLLSREAELRRVAATESQCKELEAKLSETINSGLPLGSEGAAAAAAAQVNLSSWQQECDRGLRRALDLLHAKEEELVTVRRLQQEQKAKLDELIQSMQSQPSRFPAAAGGNNSATGSKEDKEELRRWKMRCEAIEQQQRVSAQRLEELQAYVEKLRNGAQQAVMNVVASSSGTAVPRTAPAETATVQVSPASTSRPTCCWETARPGSSGSYGKPASNPYYQPPPPLQMVNTPVPASQSVREGPGRTVVNPSQPAHLGHAGPPSSGENRAAALKQLRQELDMECGRFADETQRWHEFVKHQEERWSQLHHK